MKFKSLLLILTILVLLSPLAVESATFSGMITAKRDASRTIVSAVLETQQRDGAGNPVTYNISMDENGMAIASQYENKDIKIEGTLNGRDIVAETWQEIRQPAPAYVEPEPEPEPEPAEEASEEEPKDEDQGDEDSGDKESKDEEPKDEEPKDEANDEEY